MFDTKITSCACGEKPVMRRKIHFEHKNYFFMNKWNFDENCTLYIVLLPILVEIHTFWWDGKYTFCHDFCVLCVKKMQQKSWLVGKKWEIWDMGFPQIVGSKKLLPSLVSIPIWTFVSSPSFSQLVTEFARCPYLAWEEEPPGISQKARIIIILVVICGHWACNKRIDMSFQKRGIMGLWCGHKRNSHPACCLPGILTDRIIFGGDDSFMMMKQTQSSEWYLEKEVRLPTACILKPTNTVFCCALEWPR